MSEKLFNALEICLQAIENGETIDSALKRFPALADDLRPILEASFHTRKLGGLPIPEGVQRRGRSRLLQHAAELRAAKRSPRRTWIFAYRPTVVALILVVFLLTGTGLVRASNGALPGDGLYPVKRTWEDVTLVFATNPQHREQLELTYETERVDEVSGLLAKGRAESVSFSGYVSAQTNGQWKVAGVPILINNLTILPAQPVQVGDAVMVTGTTDGQGFLVAQVIAQVAPGVMVPEIDSEFGEKSKGGTGTATTGSDSGENENGNGDSGSGSGGEAQTPPPESTKVSDSKLEGVIESVKGNVWTVNGEDVDVSNAEVAGTASEGQQVTIEGYYDSNGVFIATKVTFSDGGNANDSYGSGGGEDKPKDGGGSDDNSNDH